MTPGLVFLLVTGLPRLVLKILAALVVLLLVLILTGLAAVTSVFGWMDPGSEPPE